MSVTNWHKFDEPFDGAGHAGQSPAKMCTVCEAMLPEAVDGTLSDAEQKAFDRHVAGCVLCARELAEARRGAAWLAMLKSEAPEPPAGMLERILASTTEGTGAVAPLPRANEAPASWQPAWQPVVQPLVQPLVQPVQPEQPAAWQTSGSAFATRPGTEAASADFPLPGLQDRPVTEATRPWAVAPQPPVWALSSVLRKFTGAFRIESAHTTFQPRLAMTSAMAFFSIALTLNLTGVRLRDLRAQNFTPSGLRRSMADASASATRSFQNMRVVYQVESRVSELRSDEAPRSGQDAAGASASSGSPR